MHSVIFQVSNKPVGRDLYISEEEAINERLMDYCDIEEDRVEAIKGLMRNIPKGVFTRNGNVLTLVSAEPLLSHWKKEINTAYVEVASNPITAWLPRHHLKQAVERPIDDILFYIEDWNPNTNTSNVFVEWIANKLNPGDKIYFGAIFDYHY